jgi:hypothetical protein
MKRSDEFESEDLSAAEVELTAQDLLDLSPLPIASGTHDKAATPAASPVMHVTAAMVQTAPTEPAPVIVQEKVARPAIPEANKTKRSSYAAVLVFVGIAAVAAGVTVVFSKESPSERKGVAQLAQSTIPAAPDPFVEEPPPPVELPPVRVKNPFDESEVFELPAGTTKAEARAYVEEVLLQRAAERQAYIQARARK